MYFVNRQNYYYSQQLTVEIVPAGCDYAGADMLHPVYKWEGVDHDDPLEAVRSAAMVYVQWKQDEPGAEIVFAVGDGGGLGFELEGESFVDVVKWALLEHRGLPQCDQCHEIAHEGSEWWSERGDTMGYFCSQNCADNYYWAEQEYLISEAKRQVEHLGMGDLINLIMYHGTKKLSNPLEHSLQGYKDAVCELLEEGVIGEWEVYHVEVG